ncbi:MAG: zf-HC2 domain-containing protein [Acidobacteriota bacterium]|nr:zf-HC2 domain-containing protein [Acidobacteriota bacterium]
MSANLNSCESARIALFIDGELGSAEHLFVAEHIEQCSRCTAELQDQRQFMCELDSAMADSFELPVPPNFAEVVAVRAESDMRGVRDRGEHRKALLFSVLLALSAFALLGTGASESMIRNVQSLVHKVVGILELFGKAIYDAAAGLTVILRVLSGGLISDSRLAGFTTLVFVALAIGLLSLLIVRYHRTRLTD